MKKNNSLSASKSGHGHCQKCFSGAIRHTAHTHS